MTENAAATTSIQWSQEFDFMAASIRKNAPDAPGVYEILQKPEYGRYRGSTRVLKIGLSKKSLRQELENHLYRHTAAARLTRIRAGVAVAFTFALTDADVARALEKKLLCNFEDRHWDYPLLNSQRGYGRGEDRGVVDPPV